MALLCNYNGTFSFSGEDLPDYTICEVRTVENSFFLGAVWRALNIQVWNRTATHTISTQTGVIAELKNFGEPRPASITAIDLFTALDVLLWPSSLNATTYQPRFSLRQGISSWLSNTLDFDIPNLSTRRGSTKAAQQALSNAVLMPLYLFHSLFMGVDTHLAGAPEDPQSGLGDDFYTKASYAYSSTRPMPAFWTIMAYAGIGGLLLLALTPGEWKAMGYREAPKTAFPLLELGTTLKVVASGEAGTANDARDAADQPVATSLDNRTSTYGVLNRVENLRVIVRQARARSP